MATGEIEVVAWKLTVLNRSDVPPFAIEDRVSASEDLRLKYRYLDLRRPSIAKNFLLRDEMTFRARKVLHERGFLDVETPILTKSTPGGRPRLPRSRAEPPRGVLRAAPVAAALQAAPDGRGVRPLLPDRAMLPRRGSARRPSAGVHPDRRRDGVRDPGARLRADRGALPGDVRSGGRSLRSAVSAAEVRRGDRALRDRPARPSLRDGARRPRSCRGWLRVRAVRPRSRGEGMGARSARSREAPTLRARSSTSGERSRRRSGPERSCGSAARAGSSRARRRRPSRPGRSSASPKRSLSGRGTWGSSPRARRRRRRTRSRTCGSPSRASAG